MPPIAVEMQNTAAKAARELVDCGQVFDLAIFHQLVEAADGVLVEVGRVAVLVKRGLVGVLLVDQDGGGVVFDEVRDVGDAAGLLAGGGGQRAEDLGDLFVSSCSKRIRTVKLNMVRPALSIMLPGLRRIRAGSWSGRGRGRWKPCRSSRRIPSQGSADNPAPASAVCRTR